MFFSARSGWIGATCGMTLLVSFSAHAGSEYALDDGTAEQFIGVGEPTFGMAALNHFVAQPNAGTIVSISIAWGEVPENTPATVLLYRDPNNDGNPIDAQLLHGGLVATANPGGKEFTTYAINPHTFQPGESFFVGFWLQMPAGNWHPGAFDTSDPAGESWLVISFENFWITDLGLNVLPPTPVENVPGLSAGNWMIRANGVPGPGGLMVFAMALIARRGSRRR